MQTHRVRGACPHDCPDTCGVVTEVQDGKAVSFHADPDHPVTDGWLCAKVRPYLERVYDPNRVTHPLRRVGPKGGGRWARVSWEDAIAEIGERWRSVIAKYGAAAILPYSYSGTIGLVQMTVTSARFWNRLGASQLERTICGAAAETAIEATLGARHAPAYEDVAHSRLAIVWGHNPVSTAPHYMPRLREAQRRGCQVVVIDPRRTRTARGADLHLQPRPNTDGVLALGMAHVIVQSGLHDEGWMERHVIGWPELRERLAAYEPARVADVTGVPEESIVDLARGYATARPAMIKIADGIQRHRDGGQTVRSICVLPALTGNYGVRGGGLAYSTSGYFRWNAGALHHWDACPLPARRVNMNRLGAALLGEASDPPIMSLYVFGSNPAAIAPNAGRVVEGMRREDLFTVVHELFLTDTADLADLVLPATSQLEHTDLHKAYGHTYLTYNGAAIAPLGECRSNWEVMRLLATEMGFDEPWLHQTADEVIEEMLAASAETNPAFRGITLARLQEGRPVPLALETTVPFEGARFPTPSGKVELRSEHLARSGADPLPGWPSPDDVLDYDEAGGGAWPLTLITPAAHHFTTSSMANQPSLMEREGPPRVEIHPDDAATRGIRDGDTVIVWNDRGWCSLRAVVTDAVRPGVLAAAKGHWPKLDGGRNVNWTTPDALADLGGQSTFHSNRVEVRVSPTPR